MVGEFGETYVMDWGLAKSFAADGRSAPLADDDRSEPEAENARAEEFDPASEPVFTMDGEVIGTPAYMPPEQAEGDRSRVGPSADLYAMGAVLYHLLAGHPPYVPTGSRPTATEILERLVASAPKPLADVAEDAPEPLVAICEKAMARSVEDRYDSMRDMAEDARAYLEGRVVRAYRTGVLVELSHWIRRNRMLAASIALTIVVTLGGLVALWVLESRYTREVEKEARTSAQVVEFLVDMFQSETPDRDHGRNVTVKEILDREAPRMAAELADEPELRARILDNMGSVYRALGLYPEAEPLLRTSLELRREFLGDEHESTLASIRGLAWLQRHRGNYGEAERLYEEAAAAGERRYGPDHESTLEARNGLGLIYGLTGRSDEGEALMRDTLGRRRRTLGDIDESTLDTLNNLGVLTRRMGQLEESRTLLQEALEGQRRRDPDNPQVFTVLNNLSLTYKQLGQIDEAEQCQRDALAGSRRILGDDHPRTIECMHNLGTLRAQRGFLDEGVELISEALERGRRARGSGHPSTLASMSVLAGIYRDLRRFEESEALYLELLPLLRKRVRDYRLDSTLLAFARLYAEQNRFEEATPVLDESIRLMQERIDGPITGFSSLEKCLAKYETFIRTTRRRSLAPKKNLAQTDLARLYLTLERYPEALAAAESVVSRTAEDDPARAERLALVESIRSAEEAAAAKDAR